MARQDRYALCVKNRGYAAALQVRMVYHVLTAVVAERRRLVRVFDESGEDCLYPAAFFLPIEIPRAAIRAFSRKSA